MTYTQSLAKKCSISCTSDRFRTPHRLQWPHDHPGHHPDRRRRHRRAHCRKAVTEEALCARAHGGGSGGYRIADDQRAHRRVPSGHELRHRPQHRRRRAQMAREDSQHRRGCRCDSDDRVRRSEHRGACHAPGRRRLRPEAMAKRQTGGNPQRCERAAAHAHDRQRLERTATGG